MAVPLLLYVFYTTGIAPKHLPSDGVRAFLVFLLFQIVLSKVVSVHLTFSMCTWMTPSVNLNKLQIGCLYAGTLINHWMYAGDVLIFLPVLLV